MKNLLLIVLSLIVTVVLHAQESALESPVKSNPSVLILGGVAHLGDGEVIENSAIGIDEGHLKFVKNQLVYRIDTSKFDSVIHLNGQHVYPGFIALNNELGLREIEAVRATNDYDDVGSINPNIRSLIAFNTDSKIIPTTRVNGVLMTQVTPKGGLISGTSSIVDLAGWNWEEAAVLVNDGVHLRWPSRFKTSGWWAAPGKTKRNAQNRVFLRTRLECITSFRRDVPPPFACAKCTKRFVFSYELENHMRQGRGDEPACPGKYFTPGLDD